MNTTISQRIEDFVFSVGYVIDPRLNTALDFLLELVEEYKTLGADYDNYVAEYPSKEFDPFYD